MGNVHNIRAGEREELQRHIVRLEDQQQRRIEMFDRYRAQIVERRQLEIDNLKARLEQCDE
jgi:hypothetical protein